MLHFEIVILLLRVQFVELQRLKRNSLQRLCLSSCKPKLSRFVAVAIDLIVHHIWDIMYKKRVAPPTEKLANGTCNGAHEEDAGNGRRMSGSSEDTLSR